MQQIKNKMEKLRKAGFSWEETLGKIKKEYPETNPTVFHKIYEEQNSCKITKLQRKMSRSNLYINMKESSSLIYVDDPFCADMKTIEQKHLRKLFTAKEYKNFIEVIPSEFVYDPFKKEKVFVGDDLITYLNIYEPPNWMIDEFGQYKEIKKIEKMPQLFDKFFNHLSNGKDSEYNYIIKWLANAIQHRNHCVLSAIGAPGIGKGVLGNIMLGLVGLKNFTKTDNRLITKDFNKQLQHKRLVFCDEINIKKTNHMNKFKDLVNDKVEIEGKGLDAQLDDNYASIYIASNNLDSLFIPENDRRFSVIELTDDRLDSNFSVKEIEELNNTENIEEFAKYLYYYKVDRSEMLKVHRSKRLEDIKISTLTDAEEWFLEDYAVEKQGQEINMLIVQEAFREKEFKSLSRRELERLSERFSSVFKITFPEINGKRVRRVKFFGVKNDK